MSRWVLFCPIRRVTLGSREGLGGPQGHQASAGLWAGDHGSETSALWGGVLPVCAPGPVLHQCTPSSCRLGRCSCPGHTCLLFPLVTRLSYNLHLISLKLPATHLPRAPAGHSRLPQSLVTVSGHRRLVHCQPCGQEMCVTSLMLAHLPSIPSCLGDSICHLRCWCPWDAQASSNGPCAWPVAWGCHVPEPCPPIPLSVSLS